MLIPCVSSHHRALVVPSNMSPCDDLRGGLELEDGGSHLHMDCEVSLDRLVGTLSDLAIRVSQKHTRMGSWDDGLLTLHLRSFHGQSCRICRRRVMKLRLTAGGLNFDRCPGCALSRAMQSSRMRSVSTAMGSLLDIIQGHPSVLTILDVRRSKVLDHGATSER